MKPKGIFIRLSEEDKLAVEKDAGKLGLSVTAFMRLLYKQWSDGIRFEKEKSSFLEAGDRSRVRTRETH